MKNFPSPAGKILPVVALTLLGLAGCAESGAMMAQANSSAVVSHNHAVVPRGTVLRVRLNQTLDTKRSRSGDRFTAVLVDPVSINESEVLSRGTLVHGHVVTAGDSGRLKGRAVLAMTLDSLELNKQSHPISTNTVTRVSSDHKKSDLTWIGSGSGAGALIGGLADGGKGALIGAGAGAAAGTAGAAVTGKKHVLVPAESVLSFKLSGPARF